MTALSTRDALAKALGPCSLCRGTGRYLPYCSACSDSTYDHDCPGPEDCDHSALMARVDALLASGAVVDVATLADDEALVDAVSDIAYRGQHLSATHVRVLLLTVAAALTERAS